MYARSAPYFFKKRIFNVAFGSHPNGHQRPVLSLRHQVFEKLYEYFVKMHIFLFPRSAWLGAVTVVVVAAAAVM